MRLFPRDHKLVITRVRRALRDSSGAGVVSMVIMIPVVVLIVELAVLGGRVAGARSEIQSAARQSSREASFAAGPGSASGLASAVATASLANASFQCNSPSVIVGGSTNFVAGGQVDVQVGCTVPLGDLTNLPVPGSLNITRSAVEPIDPFRVVE